jgi:hypothetical protein
MLLAGAVAVPCGGGFVVADDAQRVMVALGAVDPRALVLRPGFAVLCAIEHLDLAAALGADHLHVERALLHTLPDPSLLPDDEGAVAIAPGVDLPLDHLPPELAAELDRAHRAGVVYAAFVEGVAVSFAFAPWRTERWFDVSVDTAPGARQLGLATRVAAAMIHGERAAGREPVWGAAESNRASLALARRLGFTEVDALWVANP